jgi:4-amino-4-deoxy-L-arabinose transferase-like glycosyltransferase
MRRPTWWLAVLAAANALLHAAVLGRYGWFRDELYYVACGRRLDWGYVDHPPFVALVARLGETLFGLSPEGARVLPVLAGSLVVVLTGLLARELSGGPFAQALAALTAMVAPVYLFLFHILSMNVFDVLFWTLAALLLARLLRGGDPRLWLLFGLVCGLGLENKHSMLFFGLGVAAGLVLTPARRHLATPWPWLGGLLAAALFLPNVLWEVRQGWPTLEFMRNAEAEKNLHLSPLAFLREQVLLVNPLTLPLWLAGLAGFLVSRRLARFRALGWIYLAVLALLLARAAKPYYLAPAYPILFAGGAVVAEGLAGRPGWRWLKPASLALLVLGGAFLAPLTLPLLPEPAFVRYAGALGIQPSSGERHRLGVLPQHFADMHGWPEMAAAVGRVWRTIPPAERRRCAVFGQNYGEAGAVELLGDRWGLPDALSAHNNYYLWGPRGYDGSCLVVLNDDRESLDEIFGDVRLAAVFRCPLCMPFEDEMPIWVCRRPRIPLAELWPQIKHYE